MSYDSDQLATRSATTCAVSFVVQSTSYRSGTGNEPPPKWGALFDSGGHCEPSLNPFLNYFVTPLLYGCHGGDRHVEFTSACDLVSARAKKAS
jgi:hypothetical protein